MPGNDRGTILVAEDDHTTASLVAAYLEREGFSTVLAHDGRKCLSLFEENKPVFVILDIMLPGLDGWEICRALRKVSNVPILMLTAREEEIDRVTGLAMGADDYVVKPFSLRELVERVKAILRRTGAVPAQTPGDTLSFGGLELDSVKHSVMLDGRPLTLTSFEYKLLQALMSSPGKAFSREELLDYCYQDGIAVIDRVIDVHIGKLRQKIEQDPSMPQYILTVRGYGYRFNNDIAAQGDT
ncbi:response regulator transcription factor [Geobacter sp. AOG2]|uniref:response regulator transcription factor n=1 Tax=Geobacter sp. AOG2 TaxID=1566347 RepID=UPI001CC6567B|nr:response regulator transcription factor [Geobacter sp. AOG2]GFE61775.1 DNA-binding response regulator [Geobacter sp. AOG2]